MSKVRVLMLDHWFAIVQTTRRKRATKLAIWRTSSEGFERREVKGQLAFRSRNVTKAHLRDHAASHCCL